IFVPAIRRRLSGMAFARERVFEVDPLLFFIGRKKDNSSWSKKPVRTFGMVPARPRIDDGLEQRISGGERRYSELAAGPRRCQRIDFRFRVRRAVMQRTSPGTTGFVQVLKQTNCLIDRLFTVCAALLIQT